MKYFLFFLGFACPRASAAVVIDSTLSNGGFVSSASGFNGSPSGWTAASGVYLDPGNSPATSLPFGEDHSAGSRFIQIHHDNGETLTSNQVFSVKPGDPVSLSFDYKTGGSGSNTILTVTLWDQIANSTYATLGTLTTNTVQASFTTRNFTHTAGVANPNLRLRFTLGRGGKDFHIDRVYLSGGIPEAEPPPEPIAYSTSQRLLASDTDVRIIEKAAKVLHRPEQVAWQRQETTFFIHYGPNAFNGVEWGTGTEPESVFNPTALDASQWVDEIKRAGGKQIMLVVKHHDGFCLWPSRYTTHDVASSPWLKGQGDLAKLVSAECAARGLKFGIYLSPADLYQVESSTGTYGNGSPAVASAIPTDPATFRSSPSISRTPPAGKPVFTYQVDDYNRYFLNQLYELLTEYGSIAEVWFDGANPKQTNPPQLYNRSAWYQMIKSLRPEALIAIKGQDVRWVGNEAGTARASEWSPLPISAAPESYEWNDMMADDLGSRSKLARGSYLTWYPAETDVPVLDGWFWSAGKSARTAGELIDIYYTSVGRNSNLLLNLSPDTRGLIPDKQLAPLRAMSQVIGQTFATNLAAGSQLSAAGSEADHPAELAGDGDLDTWWEAAAGESTGTLILELGAATTFDVISLQEAIASRGQRVESFAVDTWNGSAWTQRASATTIGHKRLLRLSTPVTADRIRVRILQSRMESAIAEISVHRQAERVNEPGISRNAAGEVSITAGAGENIRYTVDGTEPGAGSTLYSGPFKLELGGRVTAVSFLANGSHSPPTTREFGMAPIGWAATADSAQASNPASWAIDGNADTWWHTALDGTGESGPQPHQLVIDVGTVRWLGGLLYLPRQDGDRNGVIERYRIEVSADGNAWTTVVADAEFANVRNNPVEQKVLFPQDISARWVKLVSLATVGARTWTSAAEISILPGGYDSWRRSNGMTSDASKSDTDGDGWTLWQEYALGGDPRVADSGRVLEISITGLEKGAVGVGFKRSSTAVGILWQLLASNDLPGPRKPVESSVETFPAGVGMEFAVFVEIDPPVASRRFYRLLYQLAD